MSAVDTQGLTDKQKRAVRALFGSPRTASEARIDLRTLTSLAGRGIVRHNDRKVRQWSLTPAAVDLYHTGLFG